MTLGVVKSLKEVQLGCVCGLALLIFKNVFMLSNVRIFLNGVKVNVLENLLNISLTASAECVLLLH